MEGYLVSYRGGYNIIVPNCGYNQDSCEVVLEWVMRLFLLICR